MRIFETEKRERNASIKEYKCIIRIGYEENSDPEVSRQLNAKMKETLACHDIESSIKQQFSENILDGKPVKAYLTAYQETHGNSFAISFTVLVVTAITNYDEIYDALQKRLQEQCCVFDRILDKTYSVRHTLLQSTTVTLDEKKSTLPTFTRYALFLIVCLLALQVALVISPGIFPDKQMTQLRNIVKEELERYRGLQYKPLFQKDVKFETWHKQAVTLGTEAGFR